MSDVDTDAAPKGRGRPRALDYAKIAQMARAGLKQTTIAQRLGCSQMAVSYAIRMHSGTPIATVRRPDGRDREPLGTALDWDESPDDYAAELRAAGVRS